MDYLQQATERARREREGALGKTPEPGASPQGVEPTSPVTGKVANGRNAEQVVEESGSVWDDVCADTSADARGAVLCGQDEALPALAPMSPTQVRYTTTRRVEPNEQTLLLHRVIAGQVHDPRVEAYRQLRSQVLDTMQRNQWRTLAITSAHENAGKTLTALNLAISISQEVNQTVMLVDLDLRKPNVHTTLGVDIDQGIVDHLQQGVSLDSVLLNPGFPRLTILPGLPQGRHASEILTSPEMRAFVADITTRYDDRLIIFDMPPLLRNDDAMVFVPSVDCCLLVVEDGVTTPEQLDRSRSLLKHARLLGTILNKAQHVPSDG
jgi:protein-tyrosine kinase